MSNNFVSSVNLNLINNQPNNFDEYAKDIVAQFNNILSSAVMKMSGTDPDHMLTLPNGSQIDLSTTAGLGAFSLFVQSQQPIIEFANNSLDFVRKIEKSFWSNLSS